MVSGDFDAKLPGHDNLLRDLDRDVDMWLTGTRHPFLAKYRAAAGPDGKLRALDCKLWCNGGYSMDLTEPVMGRALFHSDGCYKIPNVRLYGYMCLTNTSSNTAFRGFGGPQGLMVAEAYMVHLASALKMSPEELRIKNTYAPEGDRPPQEAMGKGDKAAKAAQAIGRAFSAQGKSERAIDGNTAAAHVAYALSGSIGGCAVIVRIALAEGKTERGQFYRYLCAGELLPAVFHVSARALARQSLNYNGDYRRTSGVIECVKPIPYSTMKSIVPWDELDAFRQRGLYYDAVPGIVQDVMDQVGVITGRQYKLFEYYGDPQAETVDYLRSQGEKVGILKVRLFRPFSTEHFLAELPETVQAIAVLDRTKEDLAPSLPLHADVLTAMSEAGVYKKVVGGNYGLGSKEFAPRAGLRWVEASVFVQRVRQGHVKAVFDNLLEKVPKRHFTVGINDDVTHSSLLRASIR
ncbi:Pyruvate-flavodoxin oxidoreductase [Symbiodinium microadriaticum]|uniref:Pyruvate-flavodoxin oxidoreductase n=1 Tax=Symbiodinium microadriaticum TaxID=2951 RepID=A0A1Q9CGB8_SYMMI|nr:Pyruvate-flavodoxin oxidoreductase [Symbiodinium microadriaticum]